MKKTSKVRKARLSGCLMAGVFALFAVAGAAAFYFMAWKPLANIQAARGWTATECVITSSRVAESSSGDGSTYRIDIHYTYRGDWGAYEGDRYDFSLGSSSGYDSKAKVVEAHPPGSEVVCYYDPEDPAQSVINRSPGGYLWWSLFPIPFLAIGLGGMAYQAFAGKGRPQRQAGSGSPTRQPAPATRFADLRGPLELEAQTSPTLKVVVTLLIALFWNGIVSVFVFGTIIPGFRSGDVEWFPTLFMIPFILVGLGLIVFWLYVVLAWFNPRPHLTLADGRLTPGAETTLSWRFLGASGRLKKLTIELEGQEKARYRRGTRTHTDTHTFFSQEIVTTDQLATVLRGSATLSLPERTMPTFDANNNDIEWRLKVRGDIPHWPDVIDDFPITVYPG